MFSFEGGKIFPLSSFMSWVSQSGEWKVENLEFMNLWKYCSRNEKGNVPKV